ncbi:MAG: TIGR02757 family protein [Candidatus Eisenbacteria bacterium]|nr:TIGR02757 family protein [Candidatus Eisenbacteria bacterium]
MREALERLRGQAIRDARVERDPLRIVLDYVDPLDQEVVALLAALLAYGRVDLLQAHVRSLLRCLGARPAAGLVRAVPDLPPLRYRFHTTADLSALLSGIRSILRRRGSLGGAFAAHWEETGSVRPALERFVAELREGAVPGGGYGLRFLLADPARGGACKRWLLFLRWMVRADDIDPGVWREHPVRAAELLVPLDTHLIRVGRRLGLTRRATPDWRMAEEITACLRQIAPDDPVRYDFPLCHLGIRGACPPKLRAEHCRACPLLAVCPTGRRLERRRGHD